MCEGQHREIDGDEKERAKSEKGEEKRKVVGLPLGVRSF